jgi:hypothetical protein
MLTPRRQRAAPSRAVACAAFAIIVGAIGSAYTTVTGDVAVGAASQSVPAVAEFSTSSTARAPRAAANSPVTYHGGPVLHASSVYTVFWVPPGYSLPADYTTLINQYFSDVAHDSYLPSNLYGATVQYYETRPKRFVSYNVANKGPGIDATPFPNSGCPNYTLSDSTQTTVCLTRAQIQQEIAAYVSSHSIPTGMATQVFLFTPQSVGSCTTKTALSKGGCYDPKGNDGFCAYHSHFGSGNQAILYANMPYNYNGSTKNICPSGQSPNGNAAADAVLNNVAHEHNETITDPLGTAWYDNRGNEIADKCHLKFGKPLGSTGSGQYNQVINGDRYWLQMLWSNRAKACVQRNNFPQPIVSFTYSPSSPKHGKKVVFKSSVKESGESKWTHRWSFPDGGTATAANPTHVFPGFIFAGTVVLIVTDTKGDQTRFARTITVQ